MPAATRSNALTSATGDEFRSSRLELMLSHFTASYKLYWLRGIFDEALAGSTVVPLRRVAARMVALAWYPVTYFRLNLGATDQLASAVTRAHEACGLPDDANEAKVLKAVLESKDAVLNRRLDELCKYVPNRLVRPFYADRLNEERARQQLSSYRFEQVVDKLLAELNSQTDTGTPYRFVDEGRALELDSAWVRYFRENRQVLEGWLDMRLVEYLQARNPSVPAVPLKIHPPNKRDLKAARKWWEEALAKHQFREIYSGVLFSAEGFALHGPMSVDHFIPWSFVLHDEPWNLVPAFRDTNSSKGNQLPNIEQYLRPFCDQQFDALLALRESWGRHRTILESYATIDPLIRQYEHTESAREQFRQSVSRVVLPLHQIATNQGFPVWKAS